MIGHRNFEPTTQRFCPATDLQEYWRIQMFEYMIVSFSLVVSKEKIDQVVSAFLSEQRTILKGINQAGSKLG